MSTQHKGTNAVISAFVPSCLDYRLYNFYTVPQPHVFMHFHHVNFCIFIQLSMSKCCIQYACIMYACILYACIQV